MIVFISDLHFVDGSAGEHNVSTDAFRIFLTDIAGTAARLHRETGKIEEIRIVFLGDIFDVLRTEMWFSAACRPWGNTDHGVEEKTNEIFDALAVRNKETFDLLGGELKEEFGFPVEPERIYIPGNHDRLCNKYESLRQKARACLGIRRPEGLPFDHQFTDPEHGVLARHGHEFDKFNFEGGDSYGYDD